GAALIGLHLADPRQHHPRDAVLLACLLVEVEVIGGDRRPPGGTRRGLRRGGPVRRGGGPAGAALAPPERPAAATAPPPADRQAQHHAQPHAHRHGGGGPADVRELRPPAHELPADASWMSFTCHPPPDCTAVIA